MVKWNGPFRSDRSNQEEWSTSKGGPIFSKLFLLDRSDPFSFRPKIPEILVEWIKASIFRLVGLTRSRSSGSKFGTKILNQINDVLGEGDNITLTVRI